MICKRIQISEYIQLRKLRPAVAAVLILIFCSPGLVAQKKKKTKAAPEGTPVLWQEPMDIASRDLFLGPGGEAMKPDLTNVTFVANETRGYSKRYRVRDGSGREWVVKISKESQPDAAASRLLWAVGYYTNVTYLAPTVEIKGKGTFQNVEFKARPKGEKRLGFWEWEDNPFAGTKQLQGLKVLMPLINNWDLKPSNNTIVRVRDKSGSIESRYIMSDLGATFGKTGSNITHNRNVPKDFAKTKLIKGVHGNIVQFGFRATHAEILRDVTVEQAKWIGNILSQLSDQQIRDAFRAANYSPEEIELLTSALRARINELVNLPG
jgi:hypothetical protein